MTVSVYEDALFRSVDDALQWAYSGRRARPKGSALWGMIGGKISRSTLPTGLDASAQAGMIKAAVSALPPHQRAAIKRRFASGREWHEARRQLVEYLIPRMPGTIKPWRLIDKLVAKYYGDKVWLVDLADRHKCNVDTVTARWQAVGALMAPAWGNAYDELSEKFRVGGLCE